MNLVCYGVPADQRFGGIWRDLQRRIPDGKLECRSALGCFEARLRQPRTGIVIALLYIADRETLSGLLDLRALLSDLPVFILLNDQEPETVRIAHELRPRVILYTFWPCQDICSVIRRFIDNALHRRGLATEAADPQGVPEGHESSRKGEAMRWRKQEQRIGRMKGGRGNTSPLHWPARSTASAS